MRAYHEENKVNENVSIQCKKSDKENKSLKKLEKHAQSHKNLFKCKICKK